MKPSLILLVLTVAFLLIATVVAVMLLRKRSAASIRESQRLRDLLEEARAARHQLFDDLDKAKEKYLSKEEFKKVERAYANVLAQQTTERGRHEVTLAEIEAAQIRVKELEGIIAQYEKTTQETQAELANLSQEEASINRAAEELRNKLQVTFVQLDKLLEELSDARGISEQLNAVKTQLTELEQKILFYESDTAVLKTKYLELKAAYDALDVEYAQLYERHGS